MPECELKLFIDRPDSNFVLGEMISGRLEATARETFECRKISVMPVWRATDIGAKDSGEGEGRTFFPGIMQAGAKYTYSFELPLPLGPLTYRGKTFSLNWFLHAQADTPRARDATAERLFNLSAPQHEGREEKLPYNPYYGKPPRPANPSSWFILSLIPLAMGVPFLVALMDRFADGEVMDRDHWAGVLFSLFMTLAGLFMIERGIRQISKYRRWKMTTAKGLPVSEWKYLYPQTKYWEEPIGHLFAYQVSTPTAFVTVVLFGVITLVYSVTGILEMGFDNIDILPLAFFPVGAAMLWWAFRGLLPPLRRALAYWKLGGVNVEVKPDTLRRGDVIQCTVKFQAQTAIQIPKVTATLQAYEVTVEQGEDQKVQSRLIYEDEVSVAEELPLMPKESASLQASLQVPTDSAPTFVAEFNKVLWFLTATLQLPGWTDWKREFPLVVLP